MTAAKTSIPARNGDRSRIDIEALATDIEVAARLKIKPNTLKDWRWRGIGPCFIRFGDRCVRYRWSDVDAWLDQRIQQH
jgi:predicted DNA-binding transcriptional regulator AlpA